MRGAPKKQKRQESLCETWSLIRSVSDQPTKEPHQRQGTSLYTAYHKVTGHGCPGSKERCGIQKIRIQFG